MVQLWVFLYSQTNNDKTKIEAFKMKSEIKKMLPQNVLKILTSDTNTFNFNVKVWEKILHYHEHNRSHWTYIYSAIYNNRFNFSGPNHIQPLINSSSNTTKTKSNTGSIPLFPKPNYSYCSLKSFYRTVWNHP